MNTDSPLDLKIKSQLLVDLFNLVGIEAPEESKRKIHASASHIKRPKDSKSIKITSDRGAFLKKTFLPKVI